MIRPSVSDAAFEQAVEKLRVPSMGTEAVAPLLSSLIRLVRPEHVLEIGMGYTTPFLAAALADIRHRARAESAALATKTRPYVDHVQELDEQWLYAEPSLLAPEFYVEEYRPRLVAVDNLSIEDSSAGRVREVLAELKLDELVTVVNADLRDAKELLPDGFAPIDLAWVDAWECLYFFDHFWDLINPDGGLIVMHYLMTYPEGEAVLDYIAKVQRSRPGELEIVNLLEPHKMVQNSLTVIRRTSAGKPRPYAKRGGELLWGGRLRADAETQLAHQSTKEH